MGTAASAPAPAPAPAAAAAAGPARLDARLRARLRQGVDCNVKVLLRGARRSGKSTLLLRLRGRAPREFAAYSPSPEIAVGHVHWRNRVSEEVVKLEAWDVVDVALTDRSGASEEELEKIARERASDLDKDAPAGLADAHIEMLRRRPSAGANKLAPLDARQVDVYRDADGLVVLYCPFRRESWDVALDIVRAAPAHLPCVILRNFADVEAAGSSARAGPAPPNEVSMEEAEASLSPLLRDGRLLQHFRCSLKDSFGLDLLYSFFNVPFLQRRHRELLAQAARTESSLQGACKALEEKAHSQNYASFRQSLRASASRASEPEPSPELVHKTPKAEALQTASRHDTDSSRLEQAPSSGGLKLEHTPSSGGLKLEHTPSSGGLKLEHGPSSKERERTPSSNQMEPIGRKGDGPVSKVSSEDWRAKDALEAFLGDVDSDEEDDGFYRDQQASRSLVEKYAR